MSLKLPILQSGFIAASEEGLSKPQQETDIALDFIFTKTHLKNDNPYFFSKEITKLFLDWKKDNDLMTKFEFREQIILQAKKAFKFVNKISFPNWIYLQLDKETVGDLHAKFLKETIGFIFGVPRELSIFQWYSLLEANCNTIPFRLSNNEEFIDRKWVNESYAIEVIIQKWLSHNYGYEDMLTTLFVIFGQRTAITTANYKKSI